MNFEKAILSCALAILAVVVFTAWKVEAVASSFTKQEHPTKVETHIMEEPVPFNKYEKTTSKGVVICWNSPCVRNQGESEEDFGRREMEKFREYCKGIEETEK